MVLDQNDDAGGHFLPPVHTVNVVTHRTLLSERNLGIEKLEKSTRMTPTHGVTEKISTEG